MPWTPPTVPPNTRANNSPLATNHPDDHNDISDALTAIINVLGSNPEGGSADVTALISVIDPADKIIAVGGSTAPTGWVLCDGTAYSRATYAATFARIGTTYGVGDGTTTFNVPDLRSRFIAGKGTATWSDALNESGGSKDAVAVAHTHGQPTHTHGATGLTATQGTHAHVETGGSSVNPPGGWLYQSAYDGVNFNTMVGSALDATGSTIKYTQPSTAAVSAGAITMGGSTAAGGNDSTNSQTPTADGVDDNLPPYLTLNYCIRLR